MVAVNYKLDNITKSLDQSLKKSQQLNTFNILILSILKENGNSLTVKDLRHTLNREKSYISILLRDLEKDKLIQLQEEQSDRRKKIIKLTKKGITKLKKSSEILDQEISAVLNNLSQTEKELLNETIKAFYTILSDINQSN